MRNYAFAAMLFIIVGALIFTMFIMFNYILYNSESGVETTLDEMANERLSGRWYSWYFGLSNNIRTGFQMLGPILMGIGFLLFIASAFGKKEEVTQ